MRSLRQEDIGSLVLGGSEDVQQTADQAQPLGGRGQRTGWLVFPAMFKEETGWMCQLE